MNKGILPFLCLAIMSLHLNAQSNIATATLEAGAVLPLKNHIVMDKADYFQTTMRFDTAVFARFAPDSGAVVMVGKLKHQADRSWLRKIFVGSEYFRIWYGKENGDKVGAILANKTRLATVGQTSDNMFNLAMPDGTIYKWEGLSRKEWRYTLNGATVLTATVGKTDKKRVVSFSWNTTKKEMALLIACLERGQLVIESIKGTKRSLILGTFNTTVN